MKNSVFYEQSGVTGLKEYHSHVPDQSVGGEKFLDA